MALDLFGFGGGTNVYLSVSPACGLELIELDKHGNIKSYAQTPLDYNEAQREIANYDAFKAAVETVFAMRNINPAKATVHLSVPTVWFGAKEGLPLLLDESAITNIVVGELEQTYIFKRKEPLPFWFDNIVSQKSDSRSIFYSAVQAEAINQIRDILTGMGATLASVECSLFAELKGLFVTGITAEQMQDGYSWSLMIINNSGFQILGMQGKRILEYYEEPLPLKSYDGDEIYTAIENAAQIALMSSPSNSLVILSETDLVSAHQLGTKLQFGGQTIVVDDNKFRSEPIMDMSLNILAEDHLKVSLHAVGHITPAGLMPVDVNFLGDKGKASPKVAVIDIPVGSSVYQLTPMKATVLLLILGAIVMAPIMLLNFWTQDILAKAQEKSNDLDTQITRVNDEIKRYEQTTGKTEFNPLEEIERVLRNNRTKIMAYAALGESIPKNIYLTYFVTAADSKINVKGCADSVEEVYVFFKNLKDSLAESKLRLSKLDLKNGSLDKVVNSTASTVDDAPYVFEITNMSDSELKSFVGKLSKEKDKKDKSDNNNSDSQDSNDANNSN